MITPYQLLQESGFAQYTAMIRVRYNRDNTSLGAEKIAEMIRAIPGATRVSTVSLDKEHGIGIFNAKIISQKPAKEAYQALKQNALERYAGLVTGLDVGANTIEVKGDFILKEYKKPETNLSKVIGQLLEEGLLLEVSIEELRRQYVECNPPKITAEVFEQIVQAADNKSNYATWLCKKVADGLISNDELESWHEIIQFFDRYKQRFEKKDLNQVKSKEDLEAFKQNYEQAKEAVNQKKAGGGKKEELEPCQLGTLKTSNGKVWKVYGVGPGQYPLERKIGSGAGWCTVSSRNMFDNYLRQGGKYYIFINREKPDKEKYQIHMESNQFANIHNNSVDVRDWPTGIEFYEYLNKVEGKELPEKVKEAKKDIDALKQTWERIKTAPSVLEQFTPVSLESGGKLYTLDLSSKENIEKNALLLRDLNMFDGEEALTVSRNLLRNGPTREGDTVRVLVSNNTKDLLSTYKTWTYETWNWNGNERLLGSCLDNPVQRMYPDKSLPYCTEENVDTYTDAAKEIGATLDPSVIIRTDKRLPKLESFKWREADTRTGYRFPCENIQAGRCARAFLELGKKANTSINFNRYSNLGDEILVCVSEDLDGLTAVVGGQICQEPRDWFNSAASMDQMVKVVKFLNINLNEEQTQASLRRLHTWIKIGRWQGILKELRNTVEVPQVDSTKITVANAENLKDLVNNSGITKCYAAYPVGDISQVYIFTDKDTYIWSPANEPGTISRLCVRQSDFGSIREIKPKELGPIYNYIGVTPPNALERLLGRIRPGADPNVLQALRLNADNLQRKTIPLHQYTRGWRQGQAYTVSGNGLYGTWDQLGPLISRSSPDWYRRIAEGIGNHPGCRYDVFLYFYQDNPRSSWNCTVRAINPENNRVVWYARRYGWGEGVQWTVRDLAPEEQANAGNQGEGNYVPPQPRPERAPRQARQAQAAQQAAAAPEVAPEVREQLNRFRRQLHNSPEAYVLPEDRASELLPALGFTHFGNLGQGRSAVVYRCYEHRGQTTHVALIHGNGQTIVAGYPQNPIPGMAAADSQRWRSLTHQLDNSVRTFQQCHDVCQELHIALPVGIQGWLVYRGQ